MNNLAVDIGKTFLGNSNFPKETTEVGKLVSIIVSNAMIIAGIVLLVILIVGGISMIAGAGNDDPQQMAKGKQAATAALIGFVVVFAAYWIVQLVGRLTGINILGVP